jgi:hypothetical protein
MSAPVTNQSYIQQNNQLFDWAKTATPQQIEAAKHGLPKDSPLLLAIGMGVQYQQQARAPHPQAPQKTVMEQKLGEFAQTSPQGLPSVGGNQMAMQQVDPMRGAGIGVAPENTPAPQQAATGGLVALAQGGEVRRFAVGGGPLSNLNIDPNDPNLENLFNEEAAAADVAVANEALGGTPDASSLQYGDNKYAKDRAVATHKNLLSEAKTKKQAPSEKGIASLPGGIYVPSDISKLSEYLTPKGSKVDPNSYNADAIVANMLNKDTTPKYSEQPIGKHDILFAPADTSSAARNASSPTAKGETYTSADTDAAIAEIARLRGPEADISEEVAAAKEATRSANKEKWGTALAQGIGGMLSAQTPYMSQALGAGLLSGVSGYQSGAKDEAAAEKEQRALQMAQKKANLAGHREATDIWLAQNAEQQKAEAAARAKAHELGYNRETELMKGKQTGLFGQLNKQADITANLELEGFKQGNRMEQIAYEAQLKQIAAEADPKTRQALVTSLVAAGSKGGLTLDDVYGDLDRWMNYVNQGSQAAPQSGGFGLPLKGGMFLK